MATDGRHLEIEVVTTYANRSKNKRDSTKKKSTVVEDVTTVVFILYLTD